MDRIKSIRAHGDHITRENEKSWKEPYSLTVAVAFTRGGEFITSSTNLIPAHIHTRYAESPRRRCDVSFGHAEGNLISELARTGRQSRGLTMYVNRFPCLVCANAIGMAGFREVIVPTPEFEYKPEDYDFRSAHDILKRFDIDVHCW